MPRGIPGSGNSKYGITIAANVKGQEKIKRLGNSMQGVQGSAKILALSFKKLAGPLVAIAGAAATFQAIRKSFDVLAEREADFATLANGLTRVSSDAPKAAKALRAMADELGFKTLFDEKAFQKGFALLTSFKNIGIDSYGRVAETAADLAQINQVDLKSSFLQLAKALSDPTRGLTALSRSGVIFTEQQREMILELHNSGQQMKAQAEILRIVEGSYKGAARAAATGLAAAFDTLGQKIRDFNEALGKAAEPLLEPLVEGTTELFDLVTKGLNAISDEVEIFAQNIARGLGPIFKWIVEHLGNIFRLMDEMFAKWSNLEKLRIKLGVDEYEDLRNKLFEKATQKAVEQQKAFVPDTTYGERLVGVAKNPMKIFKPIIQQFENSEEFQNLRENIFNDLVEEAAVKELGIFETVIPVLTDVNLKFEEQKEILKGLKNVVDENKNSLDKTFGEHMTTKLKAFKGSIKTVQEGMADVVVKGIKGMEAALVDFVMNGKLAFKDLARSIIADMARIAIRAMIIKPIMTAFGIEGFAKGGVFENGNQIKAYAKGGVVNRPTMFAMGGSGNFGIMGEGGSPEAIMPLKRGKDGRLGVEAQGGGTTNNIVVNVDSSGTQTSGDQEGKMLGQVIAAAVKNTLVQEQRPGGLLAA